MKTSLGVLLTALCALLTACSDGSGADQPSQSNAPSQSNIVPTRSPGGAAALPDFTALVEQYGKAVVNVEVIQQPRQTDGRGGLTADDPLLDFFRRFGLPPPQGGGPEQGMPARGAGSGFIVSNDGYILTNAHVVADADEVTVRLTDRREFPAKVIGFDPRSDVAVIRIEAKDLPIVRMGDPSQLRPGEWVLAIGSPFGLDSSATRTCRSSRPMSR